MALSTRQPFAELGTPRLQALQSTKNRQNAITPTFTSPLKQTQPTTGKRRAPAIFDEELDSENIDPSFFDSNKKSKTNEGFSKPSKAFALVSPAKPVYAAPSLTSPSIPSPRKALSSPNTARSTPIGHSRGSPKHKRIGLLSKRRASSSPFRRVDPPAFSNSSPALPFSIDAALKGTIPDYTPKPAVATPTPASAVEESMPKSWFFEIHEDTPEQEASNLMEHSASVLDISSDDDLDTKTRNEDRGKENVPPPDFVPSQPAARADAPDAMESGAAVEHVKLPRLRTIAQDAMDEDRSPLSDLVAAEFYGEGLDAASYVTVDAGIEKPSSLSKEFDFTVPASKKEESKEQDVEQAAEPLKEEPVQILADETASEVVVAPEAAPLATEPTLEQS